MLATAFSFHTENPRQLLAERFARIAATRMAGLPVANPALAVAVPAMEAWQGEWVGVLVTPWAVNLVILPGSGGRFRAIAVGASQHWHFPSGEYEFLGSHEDGLGPYQCCSLASPAFDFPTQADGEAFARAAFAALLAEPAAQPVSRRAFLRGGLFGGGR
ncbi:[NiFe]-hydrogenase assembly chaperone HybE [Pseudothauera rhizosphaerae]|uniref:[NiFe]-hydrogenase assembly chaperone HybE n=1 Tax=Pseudothauera rhizosphaerae TaxID=2565932 RepID=UPI001454DEAA|nr:[NiFe]-hydrogenase assembly chaperone HybE [Pseudothauera rhizosphaerae]